MLSGCTGDTNSGSAPAFSAPVQTAVLLPDTGQTTSYTEIFGEDSDYRINPHSYTKLDAEGRDLPDSAEGWTMVRDNVTGLIWEVKTIDGSIHDKDGTFTWRDARFSYIQDLNDRKFGGFTDWRLPYIRELSCLIDADRFLPALNTDYFPNMPSEFKTDFWSYDIVSWAVQNAWVVRFGGWGRVFYVNQSLLNHVRAVRGEAAWEQNDYVENGDGTVTDQYTGLMWQQDTAEEQMTWEEALAYCENLSLADYDDWRLPNRNELQSLVDKQPGLEGAAINKAFPDTYLNIYWTSTHKAAQPYWRHVWIVFFLNGMTNADWEESSLCYVRAVRGGNGL
jgi:hypothetical protein